MNSRFAVLGLLFFSFNFLLAQEHSGKNEEYAMLNVRSGKMVWLYQVEITTSNEPSYLIEFSTKKDSLTLSEVIIGAMDKLNEKGFTLATAFETDLTTNRMSDWRTEVYLFVKKSN